MVGNNQSWDFSENIRFGDPELKKMGVHRPRYVTTSPQQYDENIAYVGREGLVRSD